MRANKLQAALQGLVFTLFGGLLIAAAASAADNSDTSVRRFIDDIQGKAEAVGSLRCNFIQTKTLSLFNNPIVFEGELAIIRPDKLRWEFTSPVPSVLIFNGDNGIRCTDRNEKDTFSLQSDPLMRVVSEQLWTWLDGNYSQLEKNYHVTLAEPYTLSITPLDRSAGEIIQSVTIVFGAEDKQPQIVTIEESGGDKTVIEFADYKLNPSFTPLTFTRCYSSD